jgi:flagellar protein FliS
MLTTLNDAWRQAMATPEAQQVLKQQQPQKAQVRAGSRI